MPRFFCPALLATDALLELPAGAARHVQVLRLQPGDRITLFNHGPGWDGPSPGGEFDATVTRMGRSDVQVQVGAHSATEREARRAVHLAVGMPANDRMDWLVEKATELGVASIQPLMTERSVLRLSGERADKKQAHWQSVAVASCEQCGGNRVPTVHPLQTLAQWLKSTPTRSADQPSLQRLLLSLREGSQPVREFAIDETTEALFLSGPEGGLSPAEEDAALQAGFAPASLGARVLRAETAALAALTMLA
jgi:16S rRNA (uracil1498-N3)-methyltransferase